MSTNSNKVVTPAPIPTALGDKKYLYKFLYELWARTGGEKSNSQESSQSSVSTNEYNTLNGIDTKQSVQEQLDSKATISSLGNMAFQNNNEIDITGGSLVGILVDLLVNATTNNVKTGGVLNIDTTSIGNIGVGEDTLISYTLLANSLLVNGQYLEISAWGTFAANANNKRIKLKIGTTTLLDSGALAINNASWEIKSKIIRTSKTTLQVITTLVSDSPLLVATSSYVDASEDTATSLDIFCTGEATNDDDVLQKGQLIKWFNSEV